MKQDLFNCQNGYFGDIARNVLLAKIKIDEALHRTKTSHHDGPSENQQEALTTLERTLLNGIKKRLAELNSDIDHLLKEGILTLYMELCDLREKAGKIKTRKAI